MFLNPEVLENKFQCNRIVAIYLIRHANLPLLAIKDGQYYFTDNAELRNQIKKLPFYLKIFLKK